MPSTPATEPMTTEQATVLAEFARTCKAAARSVSLYPATHPAIQTSLTRVNAAALRLAPVGDVVLTVHPDTLVIDGRTPVKPDPAIGELAGLLHQRLVGALRIDRAADLKDWHALLTILGRPAEELIAEGGVTKAWTATGREHFEIREIDYAEVLRERDGGHTAEWDRIIACCLQGDVNALDDRAIAALLSTLDTPARFGELVERLEAAGVAAGATVGARVGALLQLIRRLVDASGADGAEALLQTVAGGTAKLTPEMMLALIGQARSPDAPDSQTASDVIRHMDDTTIASFVSTSVTTERGATQRLAQAFEALVPELDRRERLLDMAKNEAAGTAVGQEAGFDKLWQSAAEMLTSYSDKSYVSNDYARELTTARTQALDVERVSDDPPERVHAWLATVDDPSIRRLDLNLLLDLLAVENEGAAWKDMARVVAAEIERRILLGELEGSEQLLGAIVRETGAEGRPELRESATAVVETLTAGPMIGHLVQHLRKIDDKGVERVQRFAHALGPGVIRPLAEALAVEENNRAIRRLRELLLGFGAAGRRSAEQLKHSSNPAVRRTAIDLLRVFGGHEALPELASMLDDADPQVQRESIRAIVQIGTTDAYAVLERALVAGSASRDTILPQLIGMRDDKAIPLLCYVLKNSAPRGKLVQVHVDIIDALGGLSASPESTATLKAALYDGTWWAPLRTAAIRNAAATALRRIGSPDTLAVLEEAMRNGGRGVRTAARVQAGAASRVKERT